MDYNEMLEKAMKKLPKPDMNKETERFKIPDADICYQGRQTIIKNFTDIAKSLRRDAQHFAKFLFKELASPGSIRGSNLVIQTKIQKKMIEKRINDYVRDFVLCHECGRPDTKLVKVDRIYFIKCESCGAKRTSRRL